MDWEGILFFIQDTYRTILSVLYLIPILLNINNISHKIIPFNNRNKHYGFSVVDSTNEFNRRIIYWFYISYPIPTIIDWKLFLFLFRLNEVPMHVLTIYDKDKKPIQHSLTVKYINLENIEYSYNSMNAKLPVIHGSLIPDYYIYNIEKANEL